MGDKKTSQDATERFYRLVWPQQAAVLRLARLLAHDPYEAEELAQDTLIKAFRAIGSFQESTNVQAWLAAILRNARIDRLRAAGKHPTISLDDLPFEPAPQGSATVGETEWQNPQEILQSFSDQEMINALGAVPEEMRWTLLLVDVEGLDQAEAGWVLAVPVGTIKSRLHRGRAMLRAALLPMAKDRRLVGE